MSGKQTVLVGGLVLTLRGFSVVSAAELRVTALTGDGRALGDVPARFADGVLSFDVEPAAFPAGALAYELSCSGTPLNPRLR